MPTDGTKYASSAFPAGTAVRVAWRRITSRPAGVRPMGKEKPRRWGANLAASVVTPRVGRQARRCTREALSRCWRRVYKGHSRGGGQSRARVEGCPVSDSPRAAAPFADAIRSLCGRNFPGAGQVRWFRKCERVVPSGSAGGAETRRPASVRRGMGASRVVLPAPTFSSHPLACSAPQRCPIRREIASCGSYAGANLKARCTVFSQID